MENQNEDLSDLENERVNKCLEGISELKEKVNAGLKLVYEDLRPLDPEDMRKLLLRKNGSIRYGSTFPEYYKKLWSIDLDVMYQQFSEFIENVMDELIETDGTPLPSLVCDDQNDPMIVLRQPENCRGIDDAPQNGDRIIEVRDKVVISDSNGTIKSVSEESSSTIPQSRFGIDWAKWFPPLTFHTFLSHYLPFSGAVSHTLYTIHLFSPNIISSLFPTGDLAVSNTILFNANVGLGFYVYFRRNLNRVNKWERIEFSVLTSTLFNFISLPAAVLIKAIFPSKSQTWLKTLFATSFSVYLLSRAYRLLRLLDDESSRSSVSPVSLSLPNF
ncbi:unnamed protein product [Caenorhabditis angaria]|uniref:Uncharacterized protein n=1 Tax=Caenorhabditis angaria TaxID=860376 RepID=A0A9P1IPS9_9PELO|nr:unnamed protein product [Caenorhabditis angaria]